MTSTVVLVSMFVTSDHGIVVHSICPINDINCRLLNVHSPYIVILNTLKKGDNDNKVVKMVMRDFEELENCDEATRKAILDFSFYISVANMDDAFKAIKMIQNENVWKSLARMCVKTKQLDMAILCLGHMRHARGARALREAMQDESLSLEAKVGILAVELKLYVSYFIVDIIFFILRFDVIYCLFAVQNDAERLFRAAKRLDLLGKLLEARNKFKEAIELARNENKIREKTSCYNYARALEEEGKIRDAIEMYTKADCHRFEVPRMLSAKPRELQEYLSSADHDSLVCIIIVFT